jgi:hypothetical protein
MFIYFNWSRIYSRVVFPKKLVGKHTCMQMWKKRTMIKQQRGRRGEGDPRVESGRPPTPSGATINASVINPPLNF